MLLLHRLRLLHHLHPLHPLRPLHHQGAVLERVVVVLLLLFREVLRGSYLGR